MAIPEAYRLSAEQKAQLQEVADLLTTIYETLVEMKYMSPESIIRGPHDLDRPRKDYDGTQLDSVREQCEKLGLDPAIVYLYSIMPYIDEEEAGVRDFFQGGAFFNQMDYRKVDRGRDPCYASPEGGFEDENGAYMYPHYTPLSECGNHSSIIIYDAKEHRIWIVDQIQRHSTDPEISKGWYAEYDEKGRKIEEKEASWGDSGDESNWSDEEEDTTSQGSSEFWSDEDYTDELTALQTEQEEEIDFDEGFDLIQPPSDHELRQAKLALIKNENSLELVRHRPASDVLRDINNYYRTLKEVPGQGEYTHGVWTRPKILRPLYQKNGWPDHFDGEEFQIDQVRAYCAERAKDAAKGPLKEVVGHENAIKYLDRFIEKHQKETSEAKTIEEEWQARFALFQAEERRDRNADELLEAKEKAARLCPGGVYQRPEHLPLWEVEKLRVDLQGVREALKRDENWRETYTGRSEDLHYHEARFRLRLREAELYEKAYIASKADAESLCPGQTFEEATGRSSLGRQDTATQLERKRKEAVLPEKRVRELGEFLERVPREVGEVRAAVEQEIKGCEKWARDLKEDIERMEKSLREEGNLERNWARAPRKA